MIFVLLKKQIKGLCMFRLFQSFPQPHSQLLSKLWHYGITGNFMELVLFIFDLSLSMYISVNGSLSNVLPVKSGIPQGSILGPLLFLTYIIKWFIWCGEIFKFIDDLKCQYLYLSVPIWTPCTNLQQDLNPLLEWSKETISHLRYYTPLGIVSMFNIYISVLYYSAYHLQVHLMLVI